MSTPRNGLPRNVKVLGWASCLNDVASEMIFPLLPQFLITVLSGNRLHLGIIEGVADSSSSLLKLWSGAWSDRLARRKGLVTLGYLLAAVARPLIGLATAPWQVFFLRSADRVGKGVRTSPRDALIADSTAPHYRGRAFGFHRAMDHLGAAIGPLLATWFLWVRPGELRTLFLVTLLPGLAVTVLLATGLDERRAAMRAVQTDGTGRQPLGRDFRLFLAALLFFTLGNSSDAFLLVRAGELGVADYMLPLLWFVFHLVKSAGNLLGGRVVDRIGARAPLIIGWLLYAAIYLAFGWATASWHAWALFVSYALYYALSEPAEKTLVAALMPAAGKGRAFGWYHFAIGITALPASFLFGGLYERLGAKAGFGCGALLALIGAVLLFGVCRGQRTETGVSHA